MRCNSYRDIPNLLRKYRKIKGFKQKDVAKLIGLKSPNRISLWENGMSVPNLVNILKLSILYQTMVDSLFIDLVHLLRKEINQKRNKS